jgi:ribosomal protein S18 acetylase RimI-like enzyme
VDIRRAVPDDAAAIAAIHVAGWRETYAQILPEPYLASLSVDERAERWRATIVAGGAVHLVPGRGFAMLGAQSDPALAADWPGELRALYVLRAAQGRGLGRALLREAVAPGGRRFTAFVLEGNDRALRFYRRTGAEEILRRPDEIDGHPIVDVLLGWRDPAAVLDVSR